MHYGKQEVADLRKKENFIHRESKVPMKHLSEENVSLEQYRKVTSPFITLSSNKAREVLVEEDTEKRRKAIENRFNEFNNKILYRNVSGCLQRKKLLANKYNRNTCTINNNKDNTNLANNQSVLKHGRRYKQSCETCNNVMQRAKYNKEKTNSKDTIKRKFIFKKDPIDGENNNNKLVENKGEEIILQIKKSEDNANEIYQTNTECRIISKKDMNSFIKDRITQLTKMLKLKENLGPP